MAKDFISEKKSKIEELKGIFGLKCPKKGCDGNMEYKMSMNPFGIDRYFICDTCGRRVF